MIKRDEIINRNEKYKLQINTLDLRIFLDELFSICQTESEVEWLNENISGALEGAMDDRITDL